MYERTWSSEEYFVNSTLLVVFQSYYYADARAGRDKRGRYLEELRLPQNLGKLTHHTHIIIDRF